MGLPLNYWIVIAIFVVGYLGIIFEFLFKLNKTAIALFIGVLCWTTYFVNNPNPVEVNVALLGLKLSDISQILFFLLGAMSLVELIDSHKGFHTVLRKIHTHSKKQMLWVIALLTFFLSAVLDNLTTTILIISMLKKLVPIRKDRLIFSCMVIIAANAGGAWTPIGDVTTTMLWIKGQITTLAVVKNLFLPSFVCMLVPLLVYSSMVQGEYAESKKGFQDEEKEPGATVVFYMGIASLLLVPLFHWLTGMAPFMGMMLALAILWFVTDILHYKYEHRQHLRIPHILTKIDVSNILFFLGILLTIDALEAIGVLDNISSFLQREIGNQNIIATIIGLFSAVVDNVPIVAGTMGMYPLSEYPQDSSLWMLIAYAAGTGGSILLIGSSAGVAMMGMEKISFVKYMKKASLPALLGYLSGMGLYILFSSV